MGVEALLIRSSRVQTCRQISVSAAACSPRPRRTPRSQPGRIRADSGACRAMASMADTSVPAVSSRTSEAHRFSRSRAWACSAPRSHR